MDVDTYDVFISYSRSDSEFVSDLVQKLRSQNLSVWYDQGIPRIGMDILTGIENALENSRFYVLVISSSSVVRQWPLFEMGVALGKAGSSKVLPVIVDDVDISGLPGTIQKNATLDARVMPASEIADSIAKTINRDKERV